MKQAICKLLSRFQGLSHDSFTTARQSSHQEIIQSHGFFKFQCKLPIEIRSYDRCIPNREKSVIRNQSNQVTQSHCQGRLPITLRSVHLTSLLSQRSHHIDVRSNHEAPSQILCNCKPMRIVIGHIPNIRETIHCRTSHLIHSQSLRTVPNHP